MLGGIVHKAPETRHSPAGIPLTRFTLEHRSRQLEAGLEREAYCRIVVVCSGEVLQRQAEQLASGQQVSVSGFIARADNRQGQSLLVLHAHRLQVGIKLEPQAN